MVKPLFVVIGAYGSGKSEYSINLALSLRQKGHDVALVDLDVVNPYFRTRDVRDKFEKLNIEVIAPEGEFSHADLPMISPRIMGAVQNYEKTVILDVGGDPAGCRTIARFVKEIKKRGYEMKLVVNTKRPFTKNADEINEMVKMLIGASRLNVTSLVCNSNLMEYTDADIVTEGINIIQEVADQLEIDFQEYCVLDENKERIPEGINGKNRIVFKYFLNKPWELPIGKGL